MKKVYVIVRLTRYEKRLIVCYADMEDAINERKRLLGLYPMANYLVEDVDFKEKEEEKSK